MPPEMMDFSVLMASCTFPLTSLILSAMPWNLFLMPSTAPEILLLAALKALLMELRALETAFLAPLIALEMVLRTVLKMLVAVFLTVSSAACTFVGSCWNQSMTPCTACPALSTRSRKKAMRSPMMATT